jgi:hypothetical protein
MGNGNHFEYEGLIAVKLTNYCFNRVVMINDAGNDELDFIGVFDRTLPPVLGADFQLLDTGDQLFL